MTTAAAVAPGRPPRSTGRAIASGVPWRTCVGCRRTQPKARLLRMVRTREGFVEPDPRRRGHGRGAYLCPAAGCLAEALRRGRWAQVFRAPSQIRPETVERIRVLVSAWPGVGPLGELEGGAADSGTDRPGEPVKGRR